MRYEIRRSSSTWQPYYWRIVAGNGQVLATSETYTSKQSCKTAIASVKSQGSTAPVQDLTY